MCVLRLSAGQRQRPTSILKSCALATSVLTPGATRVSAATLILSWWWITLRCHSTVGRQNGISPHCRCRLTCWCTPPTSSPVLPERGSSARCWSRRQSGSFHRRHRHMDQSQLEQPMRAIRCSHLDPPYDLEDAATEISRHCNTFRPRSWRSGTVYRVVEDRLGRGYTDHHFWWGAALRVPGAAAEAGGH